MSDIAVFLQPAFILQHRNYRESSIILDVLTPDYGVVSILAKGVRKQKSKSTGLLLPFSLLKLSFQGQSELKLLIGHEMVFQHHLTGIAWFCGYYINELVSKFLHKYDPHPEVYYHYQQCLEQLSHSVGDGIEQALRFFELKLLEHTGYALALSDDSKDVGSLSGAMRYRYSPDIGLIYDRNGYITGDTLKSLQAGNALDKGGLAEAKKLMRAVIDNQLQGKELKSRTVLTKMIQYLQ